MAWIWLLTCKVRSLLLSHWLRCPPRITAGGGWGRWGHNVHFPVLQSLSIHVSFIHPWHFLVPTRMGYYYDYLDCQFPSALAGEKCQLFLRSPSHHRRVRSCSQKESSENSGSTREGASMATHRLLSLHHAVLALLALSHSTVWWWPCKNPKLPATTATDQSLSATLLRLERPEHVWIM